MQVAKHYAINTKLLLQTLMKYYCEETTIAHNVHAHVNLSTSIPTFTRLRNIDFSELCTNNEHNFDTFELLRYEHMQVVNFCSC